MLLINRSLIYITGPIGIGKTTLLFSLLKSWPVLENIEVVSTDLYYYLFFYKEDLPVEVCYNRAKIYCLQKLDKLITLGKPFVWETVFAKQDKFDILSRCQKAGYKITGIYLGTNNNDLLLPRSENRVNEGWYAVPNSKIQDRYMKCLHGIRKLCDLSNSFIALDLENLHPQVTFVKIDNCELFHDASCKWIAPLL